MSPRQTRRGAPKVLQDVADSNDVSIQSLSPKNRRTMKPKRGKSVKSPEGNSSESLDRSTVRTRTKAARSIAEEVDATPPPTNKARSGRLRRNADATLLEDSVSVADTKTMQTPPPSAINRLRRHANKTLMEESLSVSSATRNKSRKNVDKSALEESLAAKGQDGSPPAASSPAIASRLRRNADATIMDEAVSVPEVDSKRKKAKPKKNAKSPKSRKVVEADSVLSDSVTIEDDGKREDRKIAEAEQQVTAIFDKTESLKSPPDKNSAASSRKRKRAVGAVQCDVVTPQSSPIVVNLSPHRSTKTPRKSPVNLGSPKTHTKTPLRLSKTPRKLPILTDSPEIFDEWSPDDGVDSQNESNPKNTPSEKRDLGATASAGQQTPSPNTSLKSQKSRPSPSKLIRIAAPVRKSSTKKSPGGNKSRLSNTPSPRKRTSKASLSPSKRASPRKSSRGSSNKKKLSLSPNAKVKAKKNSPGNESQAVAETDTENIMPNAKRMSPRGSRSPRKSRSAGERIPEESKTTPLRMSGLRNGSISKTDKNASTNLDVPPMMRSSTPRERIRRSLNLSDGIKLLSPDTSNDGRSLRRNNSTFTLNVSESDQSRIENESAPAMSDSTFDISNGVFEKSKGSSFNSTLKPEPENDQNVTYEVLEPKTPNLQRKGKKRTSLEADLSRQEHEAKRSCRVRFASPEINVDQVKANVPASADEKVVGTPVSDPGVKRTPASKRKLTALNDRVQAIANTSRRRSNSTTVRENIYNSPNNANIRRRSKSISDLSSKKNSVNAKAQNESVLRLSRPRQLLGEKKAEIKTPGAKKIPNFKEIHQKNFAKMESVVDAKKRIQQRHLSFKASALSSATKANVKPRKSSPQVAKRPAPPDASNYTKFGYKIRKTDAVNIISKKPMQQQRDKKTESRQALKGVRSNRRFQLLMEARNLKL